MPYAENFYIRDCIEDLYRDKMIKNLATEIQLAGRI